MVAIGVLLRFVQEARADAAAEKLKAMINVTGTVVRAGKEEEIPLKQLVPGDVVKLSLGAVVPAVHHHQGGDGQAVDLGGDGLEDGTDVVGLEIGGDEDDDRSEQGVGVTAAEVGARLLHHEGPDVVAPPLFA